MLSFPSGTIPFAALGSFTTTAAFAFSSSESFESYSFCFVILAASFVSISVWIEAISSFKAFTSPSSAPTFWAAAFTTVCCAANLLFNPSNAVLMPVNLFVN